MQDILLNAEALRCIRGDRLLFEGLNLTLKAGQVARIEGPNGSGKTSLLRILSGLSLPDDGEVRWCGSDIHNERDSYLAEIAFIGHANGIKQELTPLENLRVSHALSAGDARVPPMQALERVGLFGFEEEPCRTLSAGQKRRTALARLLVTGARMWVLDEPFTALDRDGIEQIEAMMLGHLENGGVIVMTTHHRLRVQEDRTVPLRLPLKKGGIDG